MEQAPSMLVGLSAREPRRLLPFVARSILAQKSNMCIYGFYHLPLGLSREISAFFTMQKRRAIHPRERVRRCPRPRPGRGSLTVKRVPEMAELETEIRPRWPSTMLLAMDSPRP